jgi:beta-glucuronidase
MLYPQTNRCRQVIDLSGIWELKADPESLGEAQKWYQGFSDGIPVGVPGSWNEQLSEAGLINYVGRVWYQKRFYSHARVDNSRIFIRFGAADFNAGVWLNDQFLGEHRGGFLPFEFDVTGILSEEKENVLIVCNDNFLDHNSIPQGLTEEDYLKFGKERELTYPVTVFDFFAYGGLSRHVHLYSRPVTALNHLKIETRIDGKSGKINVLAEYTQNLAGGEVRIQVWDQDQAVASAEKSLNNKKIMCALRIPECRFWDPDNPFLYILHITLYHHDDLIDEYRIETGIREISVEGDQLLLNGKSLFLKGFGKHEDFAVLGRGLSFPLIVKDFQLMKWIGANSFRTSHYPYAEEVMQLADRTGILIIDEVPAVSLNFKFVTDKTRETHKNILTELIRRDQNHPSVIAWSIANEPGIWGEREAVDGRARAYWLEIYQHTKDLDGTRPVTLPVCAKWGADDPALEFSDFLSLNRYWGWYEIPGDPGKAAKILREELMALHAKFGKPEMLTEFGADTLEGMHATYTQMFTEEYQIELLNAYFKTIAELPFVVGEHIWNFADFKTAQNHRRIILNKKGVFTRQREPKSAAFAVRKHWLTHYPHSGGK